MTEERLEIQALAREFAHDVVLLLANELDPIEGQFPDWFVSQMADMGFFGTPIPEEYGGLDSAHSSIRLVAEELSRAGRALATAGSRQRDGRWLSTRAGGAAVAEGRYR